jgi:hypothetical protein
MSSQAVAKETIFALPTATRRRQMATRRCCIFAMGNIPRGLRLQVRGRTQDWQGLMEMEYTLHSFTADRRLYNLST